MHSYLEVTHGSQRVQMTWTGWTVQSKSCVWGHHMCKSVGELQCWVKYCSGRLAKYSAIRHVPETILAACLLFLPGTYVPWTLRFHFLVSTSPSHLSLIFWALIDKEEILTGRLKQRSRPHLPTIELILAEFNFVVFVKQDFTVSKLCILAWRCSHLLKMIFFKITESNVLTLQYLTSTTKHS